MFKVIIVAAVLAILYVIVCILAYQFQEKIVFFPQKLDRNHTFRFRNPYQEMFIVMTDGVKLHGLLFNAKQSKGLIFYLHGNAGSLQSWGEVAPVYLNSGFDVFMLDYRGYGKSEGHIDGEDQLVKDVQKVYDELAARYNESSVIVLGYSLGSGLAAKIAAANAPRKLILQAPYYNLTDIMRHATPFLPTFLLRYKMNTNEALPACKMPLVIFHGDHDEVIPYTQALKLQLLFKPGDTLITLRGMGHNGMTDDDTYKKAIAAILADAPAME